jgi:8-oxo-dGTP pyrophosphatase MutT (NUDIX family)
MSEKPTLYVTRAALWKDITREQLLVGQRLSTSKNYPGRWEFPGGKFTPPDDASLEAMRELWEEAHQHGIRLLPPQQKLEHTYFMDQESSPYYEWLIYTHITEAVAFRPREEFTEPPEHQELKWATLEEIADLDLIPQTDFAVPYLKEQQNRIRKAATYSMPWMTDGKASYR